MKNTIIIICVCIASILLVFGLVSSLQTIAEKRDAAERAERERNERDLEDKVLLSNRAQVIKRVFEQGGQQGGWQTSSEEAAKVTREIFEKLKKTGVLGAEDNISVMASLALFKKMSEASFSSSEYIDKYGVEQAKKDALDFKQLNARSAAIAKEFIERQPDWEGGSITKDELFSLLPTAKYFPAITQELDSLFGAIQAGIPIDISSRIKVVKHGTRSRHRHHHGEGYRTRP